MDRRRAHLLDLAPLAVALVVVVLLLYFWS
jgi:nitrogen fixation-related uncharacterized protein